VRQSYWYVNDLFNDVIKLISDRVVLLIAVVSLCECMPAPLPPIRLLHEPFSHYLLFSFELKRIFSRKRILAERKFFKGVCSFVRKEVGNENLGIEKS